MRTYAILLTLVVVALATIQANGHSHSHSRRYYRKSRCCARAHTCYPYIRKPTCKAVTRPICPQNLPIYRRCRQDRHTLLTSVYYRRYFWSRIQCCTVVNCPQIFYSACSYQTERCSIRYGICTPRRYRRYRLQIICPRNRRHTVFVYLPYCCSCTRCPGHYGYYRKGYKGGGY